MEARRIVHAVIAPVRRVCVPLTIVSVVLCVTAAAPAASFRTQHFLVTAPTADYAREVAEEAERLRRDLALQWLGRELPPWRDICPIEVMPIEGAGGVTQFYFDRGQPYGWTMRVQGSRARVLDSVLPHEITHTIFATHFGRPLPRWADEGACTTTEDISERRKQEKLLVDFLRTNRGIPFNRMFEMTEYPADVLPLYAQGYSLARFLIALKGRQTFIAFVGEGLKTRQWPRAVQQHYGYADLSELQVQWNKWVAKGGQEQLVANFGPASARPAEAQVATTTTPISFSASGQGPVAPAATTPGTVAPGTVATGPVAPGPVAPVTGPHYDALVSVAGNATPLPGVTAPPLPVGFAEGGAESATPSATPSKTSNVPAVPATVSSPGWYSRRRDEHRRAHPHLMAERATQPQRPVIVRPVRGSESSGDSASATHVSRPQPPQPAQQVILEWSRSSAPAPVRR